MPKTYSGVLKFLPKTYSGVRQNIYFTSSTHPNSMALSFQNPHLYPIPINSGSTSTLNVYVKHLFLHSPSFPPLIVIHFYLIWLDINFKCNIVVNFNWSLLSCSGYCICTFRFLYSESKKMMYFNCAIPFLYRFSFSFT